MGTSCGRGLGWSPVVALCLALAGSALAADGLEGATVEELIEILQSKGVIDAEERDRLVLKHAAERQESARLDSVAAALTDGWDWHGDLRLRYELFTFDNDASGNTEPNRSRLRYRLRFGFHKKIGDRLKLGMRLSSSQSQTSIRSANQTLGRDDDFDFDDVRIDRAFAEYTLPTWNGLETRLIGGKIANPFVWQPGKDRVIWDPDVAPEGGAIAFSYPLDEGSRLFANVGYLIDEEISDEVDSKVIAAQLGGETRAGGFDLALRSSMYWWRGLDRGFQDRAVQRGNLPTAFNNKKARIGDLAGYARTEPDPSWPVLFYATLAKNFSAEKGTCGLIADTVDCTGLAPLPFAVPKDDMAYGVGLELGSSREYVKLGFGFFRVETNAVISLFTDSDLLDGFTNRQGWAFYGARRLGSLAEFKFALYNFNSIEDEGGALGPYFFANGLADRVRLQTDLEFVF